MINTKYFDGVKDKIESFDEQREILIKKTRDVIKLSKQIIYSVHRDEFEKAEELIKQIKSKLAELDKITKDHAALYYSGSYKIAVQEYVEAITYFEVIKNKKLPTHDELGVDLEYYLLGLMDLTGELVRKAINLAIKEDYETAILIKGFVSDLYGELLKLDLRASELRKKFDSIKYDLNRLEDLVFQIKLKKSG